MFFQLLFIHLFRPFLRYKPPTSPLPSHVSPRKLCTQAASMISKLLRLYKRTYGLRQIVNIAVYILHSACTIHLLNLPEKNAERDIIHGVKHLEEIAESWICARKTLDILHTVSRRWEVPLPAEAEKVFARAEAKFGPVSSPKSDASPPMTSYGLSGARASQQHQAQPPRQLYQHQNSKSSSLPLTMNGYQAPPITTFSDTTSSTMPALQRASASLSLPAQRPQPTTTSTGTALPPVAKQRGQSFPLPQSQQELWNQDRAQRRPGAPQTSPTVLFGCVDSLIQPPDANCQDWWYKDQGQLFNNWNDISTEALMNTNTAMNGGMPGAQANYGMNGNYTT